MCTDFRHSQEQVLSRDPYIVLGVKKDASQDEIQKAYRSLAKKLHPDLNPGDKKAEEAFKELSSANAILGDEARRKRFDAGEIDAQGDEKPPQHFYRDYAEHPENPYTSSAGYADFDADDAFSGIFGRHARGARGRSDRLGADVAYRLAVDFLDAVNDANQQITMPDGATLDVTLPPGVRDGQILRLRGKGRPGQGGGAAGDALVEIEVRPHRQFTRKGDDIHIELPISLADAVLGGEIDVPTPGGKVRMTAPKWTNSGAVLRLKGKGVQGKNGRGDQYVRLTIRLPDKPDPDLEKFFAQKRADAAKSSNEA
jgi:DnaJ-class molecular chaperone